MNLKVRRAEGFLKEGNKVKPSVMFRGREIVHPEIGQGLLNQCRQQLEHVAVVEKPPTMEGRFMNMILGPLAAARPKPKSEDAPPSTKAPVASEG
jgi:translation initiation factor IF-3